MESCLSSFPHLQLPTSGTLSPASFATPILQVTVNVSQYMAGLSYHGHVLQVHGIFYFMVIMDGSGTKFLRLISEKVGAHQQSFRPSHSGMVHMRAYARRMQYLTSKMGLK